MFTDILCFLQSMLMDGTVALFQSLLTRIQWKCMSFKESHQNFYIKSCLEVHCYGDADIDDAVTKCSIQCNNVDQGTGSIDKRVKVIGFDWAVKLITYIIMHKYVGQRVQKMHAQDQYYFWRFEGFDLMGA